MYREENETALKREGNVIKRENISNICFRSMSVIHINKYTGKKSIWGVKIKIGKKKKYFSNYPLSISYHLNHVYVFAHCK